MDELQNIQNIENPHDKGYKYLLSCENVFLELVESFVDKGWVESIDRQAITRIDKSYILQDFSGKEADLVYRLKIKEREVIFYLLLEMQSSVDFQMPYRLLLYMVEIWRDVIKNTNKDEAAKKDFKLPAVIPMVLYNGENNWTANRSFKEGLNEYEIFGKHVLDFEYVLIDVNRYSKEKLIGLSNLVGTVFLLDQKMGNDELIQRLKELVKVLKTLDRGNYQLFKAWLKNIAARGLDGKDRSEVERIIEVCGNEGTDDMISNLENTLKGLYIEAEQKGKAAGEAAGRAAGEAEGRAAGEAEGRAAGEAAGRAEGKVLGKTEAVKEFITNMLQDGMDTAMISRIVKMPEQEVLKIKQELENSKN